MFKYTAHPEILRKYTSIGKNASRPWDDHYHFAVSILGNPSAFFACGDFWRHYKAMEFYSQERRKEVPLNGVLIPVQFFQETKVG